MQQSLTRLRNIGRFQTMRQLDVHDGYYTLGLYCVSDLPGVWRRVGRSDGPIRRAPEGRVVAEFDGQIIELERFKQLEDELAIAGFVVPEPVAFTKG